MGKILLEESPVLKKYMSLAISPGDIWKFYQTMRNYGWSIPNDCIWNVIGENHNNVVVIEMKWEMKWKHEWKHLWQLDP